MQKAKAMQVLRELSEEESCHYKPGKKCDVSIYVLLFLLQARIFCMYLRLNFNIGRRA